MGLFKRRKKEPLFMAMSDESNALSLSVKRARDTASSFRAAFSKPEFKSSMFLAKSMFEDKNEPGEYAHLWLLVNDVLDDLLFCSVCEAPSGFSGVEEGQSYVLTDDKIEDWMINDDGRLYGGFSIRLQRSLLPEAERGNFDEYVGITDYLEELP